MLRRNFNKYIFFNAELIYNYNFIYLKNVFSDTLNILTYLKLYLMSYDAEFY